MRGKILLIRGGAIGDFVLTLPALAALRQQFPEAHLEVLGYPHIAQLAMAGGLVDKVQSIEARALAGFFAIRGELDQDLMDYFSEFDLIVSYLYDPDEIFRKNVARCTTAQFLACPHRPDETKPIPASEVFLKPLERLCIFGADPVPRLALSEESSQANQLALHPGSGSERKNWPEQQWAALLAKLIQETPHHLLLVGGEAEGDRLLRLADAVPADRITVAQSVPLPELATLLRGSIGFVGHDSGISHLAAALEIPCVLLWGESAAAIWKPPSDTVRLVRHAGGLQELPVEEVFTSILRLPGVIQS
jgi:heptosyltransferase-2